MVLKNSTIGKQAAHSLIAARPDLPENVRKLFLFIATGPVRIDEETGDRILPCDIFAQIYGKTHNHFNGAKEWEEYTRYFPEAKMRNHYFQGKKSRQIINTGISAEFQSIIEEFDEERLYIEDLKKFDPRRQAEMHKELMLNASKIVHMSEDHRKVSEYLHAIPFYRFRVPFQNYLAAIDIANQLDEASRRKLKAFLRRHRDLPKEFYFPSENTSRIYPRDAQRDGAPHQRQKVSVSEGIRVVGRPCAHPTYPCHLA